MATFGRFGSDLKAVWLFRIWPFPVWPFLPKQCERFDQSSVAILVMAPINGRSRYGYFGVWPFWLLVHWARQSNSGFMLLEIYAKMTNGVSHGRKWHSILDVHIAYLANTNCQYGQAAECSVMFCWGSMGKITPRLHMVIYWPLNNVL